MRYREHAPPRCLAPFVACFWEMTGGAGAHRVLPDGAMDILFAAGDAGASVVGPMTRPLLTVDPGPEWIAGVRFRAGAAPSMLGLAARELRDEAVDAAHLWGPRGRALGERLMASKGARSALAMLEAALVERLPGVRAPDARVTFAVAALRTASGALTVPAIARRVGMGERQLERLFDERVGYGPKTFARIARMRGAVERLQGAALVANHAWASFALDCGYADQPHLIREFRALTGLTPLAYARSMSEIDNPLGRPLATLSP